MPTDEEKEDLFTLLIGRYPELIPAEERVTRKPSVLLLMDDVFDDVGDNWPEAKRNRGRVLLLAHRISLSAGTAQDARTGDIIETQIHDVRDHFAVRTANMNNPIEKEFYRTAYGAEYMELKKRIFVGPIVTC